jgi:hypothetical protein
VERTAVPNSGEVRAKADESARTNLAADVAP